MNNPTKFLSVATLLSLCAAAPAFSQEKHIKRSDLPAAVEKTVAEQSKGATIRGFSTEVDGGKTMYEVELMMNGHSKDVSMEADGSVAEVEEEVAMSALPADVKAGLESKAGKGKITKVESLMKHDKLVAYEAQVRTAGKKSEIQVGPDGKALSHEE